MKVARALSIAALMLAGPEARAQQWVQSFAQITTGKDFVSVTMATGGPNQAGNPDLKTFKVPVDGHIKGCRHNITNGSGNYWFCGTTAEAVELIKKLFGGFLRLDHTSEDRTPAITVLLGQNVRVNVSNVRPSDYGGGGEPCKISVAFWGSSGELLGSRLPGSVSPNETQTAVAPQVQGTARATVNLVDPLDANSRCAIESTLELYEFATNKTLAAVSSGVCLGLSGCRL